MQIRQLTAAIPAAFLLAATPAHAYIGPGAGLGTIIVVLGVLAAVVMAFFGLLWFPIKRALKARRNKGAATTKQNTTDQSPE